MSAAPSSQNRPFEIGRATGLAAALGVERTAISEILLRGSCVPSVQRSGPVPEDLTHKPRACSQWRDRAGLSPASSGPRRSSNSNLLIHEYASGSAAVGITAAVQHDREVRQGGRTADRGAPVVRIRLEPAEQDRRLAGGQRFERGPEGAGHARGEAVVPAPLDRAGEFVVEVLYVEAPR